MTKDERIISLQNRVTELEEELDKERWQHAACLTLAEGHGLDGETWAESPALKAVRDLRKKYNRLKEPTCQKAGVGQGDCFNYYGLPATLDETTTDEYGKPNNWCWWCWEQYIIQQLHNEIAGLKQVIESDD